MNGASKAQMYEFCFPSPTELFAEAVKKRHIDFVDWKNLMTEPLNSSFSKEDGDLIVRLLYAVRRGRIKVIDNKSNIQSYNANSLNA
jgi:hypothetical protein